MTRCTPPAPRSRKASSSAAALRCCMAPRCSRSSRATTTTRRSGIDIVRRALQQPVRQIAENAGVDGSVVVGKLLEGKGGSLGFDAQNGEYVDMFKAGIIDPTKVVRCALQDAASVAGLLITTEAMVAERPEKKSAPGGGGGAPGMGGMGDMDF